MPSRMKASSSSLIMWLNSSTCALSTEHQHVRCHAFVLAGEHGSGLALPGRNFLEDEEGAVPVARRADAGPEARWRHAGHRAHWLGNQGNHVAFALQHILNHARAG